tara:strand:- start:48418 stop:48855 length:438 start_codon:yes stop_codon:yes gene_type:complete
MKNYNLIIVILLFFASCSNINNEEIQLESKVLLNSVSINAIGEKINFPDSNATITSAIRVLPAGGNTGIHMHEAIPVVYMIEGEITITHETNNGPVVTIVKEGESFVGATNVWHDTKVTSIKDAVAQVVFIGSTDLKNTINKDDK